MTHKTVVTKQHMKRGLREVGLSEGAIVGVHSSLSSFGWVEGGADAVIDALLETVGKTGSIVVPTYSGDRERVPTTPEEEAMGLSIKWRLHPYDPKTTPCWTGKIPDTFWRRKEALRGENPVYSLAAIGPHASHLIQGWDKLLELDGLILLLGVTLQCCTAMHLAEQYVELPGYITKKLEMPAELRDRYPPDEWVLGFGPYPDFLLMEGPCQERGIMKLCKIGEATVRLVKLRELVDLYAEYLRNYPEVFYHGCVPES